MQESTKVNPPVLNAPSLNDVIRPLVIAAAFILSVAAARAHDIGCDGKPIPANVKSACCGKADFHRLSYMQIHEDENGYVITDGGHEFHVARKDVLPSPDGCPAIFYRSEIKDPHVYCFLMPLST